MNRADPIKAISRKTLHEELVERLQSLIIEGNLIPGEKFPEKDLCEKFGVSRTPMREALKVLAADGLIVLEPNRGAWVRKITLEEIEDIFPVLAALEALAGELTCKKITNDEINQIKYYHSKISDSFKNENLSEYFKYNQLIHDGILAATRNEILIFQHKTVASRAQRARFVANMSYERWKQAMDEHKVIMKSLEERDCEALSQVLKQHINNKFVSVKELFLKGEDV